MDDSRRQRPKRSRLGWSHCRAQRHREPDSSRAGRVIAVVSRRLSPEQGDSSARLRLTVRVLPRRCPGPDHVHQLWRLDLLLDQELLTRRAQVDSVWRDRGLTYESWLLAG